MRKRKEPESQFINLKKKKTRLVLVRTYEGICQPGIKDILGGIVRNKGGEEAVSDTQA